MGNDREQSARVMILDDPLLVRVNVRLRAQSLPCILGQPNKLHWLILARAGIREGQERGGEEVGGKESGMGGEWTEGFPEVGLRSRSYAKPKP